MGKVIKQGPPGIMKIMDIIMEAGPCSHPITLLIEGHGSIPVRAVWFEKRPNGSWKLVVRPVGGFRKSRKR